MAQHLFAKKALNGLRQAHEYAVFALNIPMTDEDRKKVEELIHEIAKIINKY